MAEYIERGRVYELLRKMPVPWGRSWVSLMDDIICAVDKIPAADVREERHGKWEYIQSDKHGIFMYVLNATEFIRLNSSSAIGSAKMDGEVVDSDV